MVKGISDSRRKLSSRVQCSPLGPASTSPLPTPATPYGPIKGMPSSVNSGILPIIYKDPLISNNTACCLPNSPPYLSLYNFRVPKPYTAIPTTLPTADSLDTTDRITLSQRRANKVNKVNMVKVNKFNKANKAQQGGHPQKEGNL